MPKRYRSGRAKRSSRRFKRRTLVRGRKTPARRQIHKFARGTSADLAVQGASTDQLATYVFTLSDIQNASEITSLYDAYRITGVSIRYIPQFDRTSFPLPPATVPVTAATRPLAFTVMDWDSAPGTLADLRQYSNYAILDLFRPKKWFIRPNPDPVSNRYTNKKTWIDMALPNLTYRGLSIGVVGNPAFAGVQPVGTLQFKYYFECKATR